MGLETTSKDMNCFSTFYSFNLTENEYTVAKTVYAKLNEKMHCWPSLSYKRDV